LFYSALPLLIGSALFVILATKLKASILTRTSYPSTSIEKVLLYIALAEILSGATYAIGFDSSAFWLIFFFAYMAGFVIEFIRMSQSDTFSLVSISSLYALSAIFIDSLLSCVLYIVFFALIIVVTIAISTKLADVLDLKEVSTADKVVWAISILLALISGLIGALHAFFGLEAFGAILGIVFLYATANISEALAWLYQYN
jgi:hypothetical protein